MHRDLRNLANVVCTVVMCAAGAKWFEHLWSAEEAPLIGGLLTLLVIAYVTANR